MCSIDGRSCAEETHLCQREVTNYNIKNITFIFGNQQEGVLTDGRSCEEEAHQCQRKVITFKDKEHLFSLISWTVSP